MKNKRDTRLSSKELRVNGKGNKVMGFNKTNMNRDKAETWDFIVTYEFYVRSENV